jgi:HAD superfamily hydrolase (TIGR01509 family)
MVLEHKLCLQEQEPGNSMIRALIFDFDGLIIDTELSEFQSWQEIYKAHNVSLPLEEWVVCIGGASELFDVYGYLETQLGQPVQREEIAAKRRKRHMATVEALPLLPGVEEYITGMKRLGLKLGMASSSSRAWVTGHLARLGLLEYFDFIKCGDEVRCKKPDPELYLAVLDGLGITNKEAIVLEDSPNGVLAANHAGIFSVAVPNVITGQLPLDHASMRITSMKSISLEELIAEVERRQAA